MNDLAQFPTLNSDQLLQIKAQVIEHGLSLGFADIKITDTDVSDYQQNYESWLQKGYQGGMQYLENNLDKRFAPAELHPNTCRIISVRLNYLPDVELKTALADKNRGYIARYALGRDYHKMMRKKITLLGKFIESLSGTLDYRAFVDSAPVLERPIAKKAGLGWIGKNTLILNEKAGSWFFLGELFINLPLEIDAEQKNNHCGSCTACLDVCPTDAFVSPWVMDAKKCISYLTIEHKGSIPIELRSKMGNRIYGCDDCQIFCPWTKFSPTTNETDFWPRHDLDQLDLLDLFDWDEPTFLKNTEGSAIRRTGFENWQRNIAIALGNAPFSQVIIQALNDHLGNTSNMVDEHILWAIEQQQLKRPILIN
ncbi:tRNA epoxyqueuosine(34) reductase QueG [Marinicellulosiphila megalodicopiae]|uniref:tRNA epoxyqueuosine(34) reductase QueG n=1 Tax=Marinicellulosiphila megalodicopiae TaxID=2724896 RepID=UPI003BB149FA